MDAGTEPVTLLFIIILVFILCFFLVASVARLVDPALIQRVIRGRMAWHGMAMSAGLIFTIMMGCPASILRFCFPYIHIYYGVLVINFIHF